MKSTFAIFLAASSSATAGWVTAYPAGNTLAIQVEAPDAANAKWSDVTTPFDTRFSVYSSMNHAVILAHSRGAPPGTKTIWRHIGASIWARVSDVAPSAKYVFPIGKNIGVLACTKVCTVEEFTEDGAVAGVTVFSMHDVQRSPAWRASSKTLMFVDAGGNVVSVDKNGRRENISVGEVIALSPSEDDLLIKRSNEIVRRSLVDGKETRVVRYRSMRTLTDSFFWSADSGSVFFNVTAGLSGYSFDCMRISLAEMKQQKIWRQSAECEAVIGSSAENP